MSKLLPPIHLFCSDDELRPALCHVEILDGVATATNGNIIARINLNEYSGVDETTIQQLSGQYIHADVWKLIHDATSIEYNAETNKIVYHKGAIQAEIEMKDPAEVQYPDYGKILNRIANAKFDKKAFIAFNPKWVELCRKLFTTETVVMRFYEQEAMFVLFPGSDAKAFVGIMPMDFTSEDAVIDLGCI